MSAKSTAVSKSASAKMTLGFLPPSSSATFFTVTAAVAMMCLPVSSPPVKETMSTAGSSESGAPASGPAPRTRLAAPAGSPASSSAFISRMEVEGVSSLGLRTIVFPARSAGATFQLACSSG